jgi:DNA primase
VMFPIADAKGRVIAFGGRAMAADAQAKYLNTSETTLFHKGRLLYNHHTARKAAHDKGTVIAVEGYVDVIAMAGAGFPNTVAPLGTALTEDQLALLWRMADEPVLCFDGDKAGRKAAYRAIEVALPAMEPGKSLRFAMLPEGQDPDDLARSGGAGAVAQVIEAARPLSDLLWTREVEAGPLDTPERRAAFERRIGVALAQIRDETTRRYYRADMDQRLAAMFPAPVRGQRGGRQGGAGIGGAGYGATYQPGQRGRFGSAPPLGPAAAMAQTRAGGSLARSAIFTRAGAVENPREAAILLGLLMRPALLAEFADEIAEVDWQGRAALAVAQALLQAVVDGAPPDGRVTGTAAQTAVAALERVLGHADRARLSGEGDDSAAADVIRQAVVLHRRARTLHTELKAAESAFAGDASEANLAWLLDIKARLTSLDGTEAAPGGGA